MTSDFVINETGVLCRRPFMKRAAFIRYLENETEEIERVVSGYLQPGQRCEVNNLVEWKCGTYNVCIPVSVTGSSARQLAFKCPLPDKFRGLYDLMDEKIGCEAGASVWISQNCRQVPIPKLWGFGLSNGLAFMPVMRFPWYQRLSFYLESVLAWLSRKPICRLFAPQRRLTSLGSGFILMDYVEEGVMLSSVIPLNNPEWQKNLYKSVARIMLDLAQPTAKIGSFTIDSSGQLSLSNRPLTMMLAKLETQGTPTNIPKERCYSEVDSYLADLLHCHDLRLAHMPHSIRNEGDGEGQLAVLTMMRGLISPMTQRGLKPGPFVFRFTDLNSSNFLVDEQCNIIALIDLEWLCSLPVETLAPPYWLSGHYLDDLLEDEDDPQTIESSRANIQDFEMMSQAFHLVYKEEDMFQQSSLEPGFRAMVMETAFKRRTHWLWLALNNPEILYNIFMEHIQPVFAPSHLENPGVTQFQTTLAPYWSFDALIYLVSVLF